MRSKALALLVAVLALLAPSAQAQQSEFYWGSSQADFVLSATVFGTSSVTFPGGVGSASGLFTCGTASQACAFDAPSTTGPADFNSAVTATGGADVGYSFDVAGDFAAADCVVRARDNGTTTLVCLATGTGSVQPNAGSATNPAFSFADSTGTGWYHLGSHRMAYASAGSLIWYWHTDGYLTANGNYGLALAAGSLITFSDLTLGREAAGVLQLGADANGAVVSQTIKAPDGITGTDIAGASTTVAGGRATGSAAGGNVRIQASTSLGTGTTAQTLADRDLVVAKAKTLTDNSATTFLRIAIASDSAAIVQILYEVDAENATDQQVIGGIATVPIINDAGAETCGTIVEAGEANTVSVGTISATITCTGAGTNTIDLAMTSDSSLNVTPLLTYRVLSASSAGVTVTPQ
jgi:hypothetical protein